MTLPLVVVIGAGGIGHPCVASLIASKAVALRVVDDDRVDRSNLHRLPFTADADVGVEKVEVLARLANGAVPFEAVRERFVPEIALSLIDGAALVIDACDNYATRFLVADACAIAKRSVIHGAAVRWEGTVLPVRHGHSACYRCVFEAVPQGEAMDCASAGIFGPVTSVIGAVMASDALRFLRGDHSRAGSLFSLDALSGASREHALHRRDDCENCSGSSQVTLDERRYVAQECAS